MNKMNNMNKVFKNIVMASTVLLLSSCGNEWLNETSPDDSISSNQDITIVEYKAMKNGLYDGLQWRHYYGSTMIYDGDIKGDDLQYYINGASKGIQEYDFTFTPISQTGCWQAAYYVIKVANGILETNVIDDGSNAAEIKSIKGQAYLMRALAHFDLLRQYGEFYNMESKWGIPIVDKQTDGGSLAAFKPGRNSVADVYAFIVDEIVNNAIPNLGGGVSVAYANAWTAKALLSRVYLYMGENAKCLTVSADIITNSPYSLWTNAEYAQPVDYATYGALLFPDSWGSRGHSESILELTFNSDDNKGAEALQYFMSPKGDYGYGAMTATYQFMNLFDDNDVRKNLFVTDAIYLKGADAVYADANYLFKYPGIDARPTGFGHDPQTSSVQMFRLSEVYLNGAEAAQKAGDARADTWLNDIAQRANPEATTVVGANLERILLERRLELCGEGFRFYDAIRNNKNMYRDNVESYMAEVNLATGVDITQPEGVEDANKATHGPLSTGALVINRAHLKSVLPIPEGEMNVNPILKEQQYPTW